MLFIIRLYAGVNEMSNEDKILEILTSIQTDITGLKSDVAGLKEGQAKLEEGQAKLEAGQSEILKEVKAIREQTEDLVEFKAETRIHFKDMDKKLDAIQRIISKHAFDIAELQTRAV